MSPRPQVTPAIVLLLTNRRPSPWIGVGQKSSAAELIGSGRLTGAPQGSLALARVATQMSRPPLPPGRLEAMYRLSPSGDWIGHPSVNGVFRSGWFPAISSIFCAGLHAENSGPADAASAPPETAPITRASTSARLRMLIASPNSFGLRRVAPFQTLLWLTS